MRGRARRGALRSADRGAQGLSEGRGLQGQIDIITPLSLLALAPSKSKDFLKIVVIIYSSIRHYAV